MRNLKRVLSLSLASVMLFGMMVVGASAVQGFPDVDDEDNVEAIDVLQQVEVMIGDEKGDFRPDDPVTRAEMMVIMAKLLDLDYNYYATSCPFTDVPNWAKGYVGAAYANKVAYGRGDGIFDPNSTITPVEAAAFLMRALGYFQYSNDYADGFELATVRQGTSIRIFDGVSSSASEPMTRNQVAQMVLNTLESGMVQPDGNTINLTTPDGSVLTGKVNYVFVTSTKPYATAIYSTQASSMGSTNDGSIVEMGEQLYDGKLRLSDSWIDDFGRPARHWEYDGLTIGTYIKKELIKETYTTKITGRTLYDLLGSEIISDYKFTITIDGETEKEILNSVANAEKAEYFFDTTAMKHANTNQVGGTGNGVLTQVFVDGNKKLVYIAIINTYLAVADADYNSRRDEASFTTYRVTKPTGTSTLVKTKSTANVKVSGEDFESMKDIKGDDVVLFHIAKGEVKEVLDPEIIDETEITAFKTDSYVVADGTQYNYASTAMYDPTVLNSYVQDNMKNVIYRIYLDSYGYLIGVKILDSEKQYVFLTGINSTTENLKDQTAVGNVVFLDGTSATVTINMKDSKNAQNQSFNAGNQHYTSDGTYVLRVDTQVSSLMNTWCSYSVDDNGIYTLLEVPNDPVSYADARNTVKHGQNHMGGTFKDDGGKNDPATADTYYINGGTTKAGESAGSALTIVSKGYANKDGANENYVKIDKGHVSLDGIPGTTWVKVYGNNDTVYLSAELDYLSAAKNTNWTIAETKANKATYDKPAVIITGASSVSVGVQDVDLKAYNAQAVVNMDADYHPTSAVTNTMRYMDVSDGVYTLFDKNGYVIAAMVVGAEDGNLTFAWVSTKDVSREGLVDGKWEYSRDVIINGQEDTLVEYESNGMLAPDIQTGKTTLVAGDNSAGERGSVWLAVKTKADGTVSSAEAITASGSGYKYVYDINDDTKSGTTILNQSFGITEPWTSKSKVVNERFTNFIPNRKDTTEIDGAGATTYIVRAIGNTLQVEGKTGKIRGYAVNPAASIAVVKDEQIWRNGTAINEWNWKADIEYFSNNANGDGLKQAVNYLNKADEFVGYIAAVIKDGRAECVIIYDKSGVDVEIGGSTGDPLTTMAAREFATGQIDVYYLSDDVRVVTAAEVNAAVKACLESQGYKVDEVTFTPNMTAGNPWAGTARVTYLDGTAANTYYINRIIRIGTTPDTLWNNGKPWAGKP